MNTTDSQFEKPPDQPATFWRAPIRFLFGYDIFISYARGDAESYAELLETKLEAAGFATFRDKREISAGEILDSTLKRAIRRSRHFVLLDTPAARRSPWVRGEIKSFLQSKAGRLTRINLGGASEKATWPGLEDQKVSRRLEDFVWTSDSPEAFASGKPSDGLIEEITSGFGRVRLRNLMRLTVAIVITTLSGLLIWSVQKTIEARRAAQIATARELIAASMANLSTDPERSILLAMHAGRLAQPFEREVLPDAENQLHRAILNSRVRISLSGHSGPVKGIAWNPDGMRIVVGYDHAVKIWNARGTPDSVTLGTFVSGLDSVAWSPDGKKVGAGLTTSIMVWDADTVKVLCTRKGAGGIIAWHPNGEILAVSISDDVSSLSGNGDDLGLWDQLTCTEQHPITRIGDEITSVAWSPDGRRILTGTWCDTCEAKHHAATVWDAATGRNVLTLLGHGDSVQGVAWSPDGKQLATGSDDLTAKVWDAATGRNLLTLVGYGGPVTRVTFSPNSHLIAGASQDGTAKVWNAATGSQLWSLPGHEGSVTGVAWSPDGEVLATGSDDGTVRLWAAGPNTELPLITGHGATVWSVAWSPDGKRLATGSSDGTVKVWDAETAKELFAAVGHSGQPFDADIAGVLSVAWSGDGKRLATGGADKVAKVWDTDSGRLLLTVPGPEDGRSTPVMGLAWSPDGKSLATGGYDGNTRVWNVGSGGEVLNLFTKNDEVRAVAWSPDGKLLADAGEVSVRVWNAETGSRVYVSPKQNATSLAWSPDGKRLAIGLSDGTVKVRERISGKELLTLLGNSGAVLSVAWSPDGELLATAGSDGTTKVWYADTGSTMLTLSDRNEPVTSVAWSPYGNRLAAAGSDGFVELYLIDFNDLMALARRRVTRNLNVGECRQYLHVDSCPPVP